MPKNEGEDILPHSKYERNSSEARVGNAMAAWHWCKSRRTNAQNISLQRGPVIPLKHLLKYLRNKYKIMACDKVDKQIIMY